ncbi:MAG: metalloregulator ArsR/SmtB family transcription factor [Ferrovibrio sp.]
MKADLSLMQASAADASRFLRALANEKRLLMLCQLLDGERSVGVLAEAVGLSQSALSQHLTKLREDGLVATRRDSQTIYYRLADPRIEAMISLLYQQFCAPSTR